MSSAGDLVRQSKAGIVIRFRLTPKSSADRVEGIVATAEGPALQARVRAAPSDGEANEALVRLVAAWAGLPKGRISVTHGHKSRIKLIEIAGAPGSLEAEFGRRLGLFASDSKST